MTWNLSLNWEVQVQDTFIYQLKPSVGINDNMIAMVVPLWDRCGLKVIVCVINNSRRDWEGEKRSENKTGTLEPWVGWGLSLQQGLPGGLSRGPWCDRQGLVGERGLYSEKRCYGVSRCYHQSFGMPPCTTMFSVRGCGLLPVMSTNLTSSQSTPSQCLLGRRSALNSVKFIIMFNWLYLGDIG